MRNRESVLPRFKLFDRRAAVGFFFAVFAAALELCFGAHVLFAAFYAVLFLLLGVMQFDLPAKAQLPITVLTLLLACAVGFYLTQSALDVPLHYVSPNKKLLGILIAAIVLVFFLLLTARPFAAVSLGLAFLLCLSTVNYYVFQFQGIYGPLSDLDEL